MRSELEGLVEAGVSAMFELSPRRRIGHAERIREAGDAIGIRVEFGAVVSEPPAQRGLVETAVRRSLEEQLSVGTSGIRAAQVGLIELSNMDQDREQILSAALRTAQEFGVAVTVSSYSVALLHAAANMAEDLGLPPDRLVVANADRFILGGPLDEALRRASGPSLELGALRRLLARGVTLCFDRFGLSGDCFESNELFESDFHRLAALNQLMVDGYEGQLVLGADSRFRHMHRAQGGDGLARGFGTALALLERASGVGARLGRVASRNAARLMGLGSPEISEQTIMKENLG